VDLFWGRLSSGGGRGLAVKIQFAQAMQENHVAGHMNSP
jgi:hypothetical protein